MNRAITYIKETIAEMKHVNWPKTEQVSVYTALVIAISLIVAAALGGFDWLFTLGLEEFIL